MLIISIVKFCRGWKWNPYLINYYFTHYVTHRQWTALKNFQSKIRHMNEPSLHWYERDLEALQAWDYMYDWKKSLKEFICIIYINKMYLLFGSTYMRTSVVFGFETLFWCVTFQKVLRKCTSEDKTH
jgi:hypothetical protein